MILFLDSNVLIYLIEGDISLAARVQETIKKVSESHSEIIVAVSALTVLECRVVPLRNKDKALLQVYDDFFSTDSLHIVDLSRNVLDIATSIRAETGLKTPDALHAASCLSLKTGHYFLTEDRSFGQVSGLNVRSVL